MCAWKLALRSLRIIGKSNHLNSVELGRHDHMNLFHVQRRPHPLPLHDCYHKLGTINLSNLLSFSPNLDAYPDKLTEALIVICI